MVNNDLILDGSHTPDYGEISDYFDPAAKKLWMELNLFVQDRYKVPYKIMYSKCSAKPGWNVKYQKSGKSICTLYPERQGFVALVVVTLDLLPLIEALAEEFTDEIRQTIKRGTLFNGTVWLMLPVYNDKALDDVKQLLLIKHEAK